MRTRQFGCLPKEYADFDKAKVVILPVPFESNSTWIKGTDKGPEAILEASCNMDVYDIATDSEVYKAGIHTADPVKERKSHERLVKEVESRILQLLKKRKFPVIVGGDHSVSIGAIKAFAGYYKDKDFSVLQFDSHANLRNEFNGSSFSHECVMARAAELAPVIQVGIRSMSFEESEVVQPDRIFYGHNILDGSNKTWMYDLFNKLTKNVYITIDLSVFDPSIMASTCSPEPGGLQWYQMLEMLSLVSEKTSIVGFDIVGLCPMKYNKAPELLAAKLLYQLLTFKFAGSIK